MKDSRTEWCNGCHGYTHMPYCPSCESDKEVIEQRTHCSQPMRYEVIKDGDVFNGQQLAGIYYCEQCCTMQPIYKPVVSPHQPAARGGGDEWQVGSRSNAPEGDATIYTVRGNRWVGQVKAKLADQIVTEHNQHQSLVAERNAVRRAIAYLICDGIVNCDKYYPPEMAAWARDLMVGEQRVGIQLIREAIATALNQQRSTSE